MLRRLAILVEQELRMGNLIAAQGKLLVTQEVLLKTQERLHEELAAAANYVRSLIPPPLTEPVTLDWRYVPSDELGGDCLGYHFLGDNKIAVYVLDICGHGVGAALLSVVLLDVLRSRSLTGGRTLRRPARSSSSPRSGPPLSWRTPTRRARALPKAVIAPV